MVPELVLVICTFFEIFVILWGLAQLNKELRHSVEDLEESMDSKLALVLQNGIIGDPINPIQAAIANMMQSAAERSQGNIKEVVRDESGLFSKKD